MARPLRIEFPNALYHLTSRGDDREAIYFNSNDREYFINLLGTVCKRYHWQCYAYCLMPNHYHLVVETLEPTLSRGMRHLNGVYTRWLNREYGRTGHIFQGRFHSVLVEKDNYLLELARYVMLNPVRAELCRHPGQYRWSSYNTTMGLTRPRDWLSVDWLLLQFGERRYTARRALQRFIQDGIEKPVNVWDALQGQMYLAREVYITQMQKFLADKESLVEIPRAQTRVSRSLAWYARNYRSRKEFCYQAHVYGLYTMKEIAEFLGLHYQTVSRDIAEFENLSGCGT